MERAVSSLLLMLLLATAAAAAPGEQRVIRGVLEWPAAVTRQLVPEGFLVVRGDDGRHYYAEVIPAVRGDLPELRAGDRVVMIGVEGVRPHVVTLVALGRADAAPGDRSGSPVVQGAPPAAELPGIPPAASPPIPMERTDEPLSGRVDSVTGATLRLTTPEGGRRTVDISRVRPTIEGVLKPGDEVTVFGQPAGDDRFVATGFIHVEPTPASALPRQP